MDHSGHNGRKQGSPASRANIVLVGFVILAGFYLILEHRAHLLGWLPWVFLLACPLMHLFMHGGHGGHGGHGEDHRGHGDADRGSSDDRQ